MWNQNLLELFTNIIPQGFAIFLLYFILMDIKFKVRPYILFSVGVSFVPFLLRPYVAFGVHTLVSLAIIIAIGKMWGKRNFTYSFFNGIILCTISFLSEWVTFLVLELLGFDIKLLDNDPYLRILIGLIPISLMFAVSLILYKIKKQSSFKSKK